MISAAFRLGVLYALVWLVSVQWGGAFDLFRGAVGFLTGDAPGVLRTFGAFGAVAFFWGLCQLPFWICALRVERLAGPRRHAFSRQPLRRHLRFGPSKFLAIFLLQLLGLLLLLRVLPEVVPATPTSVPEWLAVFDHLSGRDVWLAYGLIHLAILALGWVGLMISNEAAVQLQSEPYGFFRYQLEQSPLARKMASVLIFGIYPVAAFSATSHPHPWHLIVIAAVLAALLAVVCFAQLMTLAAAARHQRWLDHLDLGWRENEAVRRLRERTIRFLHPGIDVIPDPSSELVEPMPVRLPDVPAPIDEPDLHGPGRGHETGTNSPESYPAEFASDELVDDLPGEAHDDGNRERPDKRRILGGARTWMTAIAGVLAVGLLAFLYQWVALPSGDETRQMARSAHVHIRKTGGGEPRVELLGTRYDFSLNTRLENVSPHFVNAVIASEDHRFLEHGVTYKLSKFAYAGVRCVWRAVNVFSPTRGCRGNSTIGQQLARNLFISEERSLIRKFKELVWAIKMEFSLSKQEILQAYLNRIYLGDGNFGVEMASRSYFGKSASRLGLLEAAYLASAVKRPRWNWHQDRAGALKRGRIILSTMRRYGFAPAKARMRSDFAPRVGVRGLRRPYLGHLWQFVQADVRAAMADLPDGDYKVLTSLNAEVQVYARRRLASAVARMQANGVQVTQGAAVVMRPNGAILAMVGGIGDDITGRGTNRAKRTEGLLARPPASAFKPVLYLAALEAGLEPETAINARPVSIKVPGSQPYAPTNHDGKTYGTVTLQQGLVHSINTAAVNLLHDHVGFDALLSTAKRLGISEQNLRRQWGLALGQSGVPVVTMAGAYAAFANGGYQVTPHAFLEIIDEDGRYVWQRERPRNRRQFKRRHISQLNTMLSRVLTDGTGFRAVRRLPDNVHIAGKTGTGDGFVDAWFIGYGADIVIAVWLGNDRPQSMKDTYGGGAPAQVFNDIVRDLYTHTDLLSLQTKLP